MLSHKKIRDPVLSALGAALISVCSWLTVPAAVPFTMQTFAVYCVLYLFGGRIGLQAIAVYIAIGAVGAPVFSGFSSGIGQLLGQTGGYIIGFLFIGLCYALSEKLFRNRLVPAVLSLGLGTAVCYAFGTGWFMLVYAKTHDPIGLATALGWCVVPYIVPDALKLLLAVLIARKLRPICARTDRPRA